MEKSGLQTILSRYTIQIYICRFLPLVIHHPPDKDAVGRATVPEGDEAKPNPAQARPAKRSRAGSDAALELRAVRNVPCAGSQYQRLPRLETRWQSRLVSPDRCTDAG